MPEVFLGLPSVIDAVMLGHLTGVVAAQKRLHQQWLELPYTQAVELSAEALVDAFRTGAPQQLAAARLRR
jgi:hypothetical protein